MKGTLLGQLRDQYNVIEGKIADAERTAQRTKQAVGELETRLQAVEALYAKEQRTEELKSRINDLQEKLVWAHIAEKEREVTGAYAVLAAAQSSLRTAQQESEVSYVRR